MVTRMAKLIFFGMQTILYNKILTNQRYILIHINGNRRHIAVR